jgi:hypothetical protein
MLLAGLRGRRQGSDAATAAKTDGKHEKAEAPQEPKPPPVNPWKKPSAQNTAAATVAELDHKAEAPIPSAEDASATAPTLWPTLSQEQQSSRPKKVSSSILWLAITFRVLSIELVAQLSCNMA